METQGTLHFTVNGTTVAGSGSTTSGQDDFFYGQDGVSYNVTIDSGANLYNQSDNTVNANPTTQPADEVIYMSAGNLVNNGVLNTYPKKLNNPAANYKKTSAVVYINNTPANPSQIINNGTIGDFLVISNRDNPFYSYDQENSTGIFLQGNGTITNNRGATISGSNAVFTKGNGTLNNYGTVVGGNDAALTGFVINNYADASMSNGTAGFACVHAYNNVNNYGYMLGQDYGVLAEGRGTIINDYGGAAVPGVTNFDGSQVYNGEISALIHGSETPNVNGPFLTNDAIMMDTNGATVNLISTTVNNTVYLPVIVGPMEGGFNGNYNSATANVSNTLNFNFNGLNPAEAGGLQAAITNSARSSANGTYYSGSFVLRGITYQWEDFAHVAYNGTLVQGVAVATTVPGATATVMASVTQTPSAKATAAETPSAKAMVATTNNTRGTLFINTQHTQSSTLANSTASSSASFMHSSIIVVGLLTLIVLGIVLYRFLRKRMQGKQQKATQQRAKQLSISTWSAARTLPETPAINGPQEQKKGLLL